MGKNKRAREKEGCEKEIWRLVHVRTCILVPSSLSPSLFLSLFSSLPRSLSHSHTHTHTVLTSALAFLLKRRRGAQETVSWSQNRPSSLYVGPRQLSSCVNKAEGSTLLCSDGHADGLLFRRAGDRQQHPSTSLRIAILVSPACPLARRGLGRRAERGGERKREREGKRERERKILFARRPRALLPRLRQGRFCQTLWGKA